MLEIVKMFDLSKGSIVDERWLKVLKSKAMKLSEAQNGEKGAVSSWSRRKTMQLNEGNETDALGEKKKSAEA